MYATCLHLFSPHSITKITNQNSKQIKQPITFPDTITVVHKFEPLTEPDRFVLKGVVISHNAKKVASRIKEVIVTVDYANGGVKAPIPEPVKDVIKQQYDLQYNL